MRPHQFEGDRERHRSDRRGACRRGRRRDAVGYRIRRLARTLAPSEECRGWSEPGRGRTKLGRSIPGLCP
ncbi:hypothetical protein SKAU_G00408920 [Synaphobranchus kaupii]|uniref:Uncharacterized protein n=1 Tax=Synaphobranchus kaupii TaxID=118154 RepID=A0A9Q1EAG6_SYNKA|nr:hypothetical protein SKAU_G00408920 [Synaphobranchus kaupii]